ncbi:hypothetical protein MB84_27840 (plasmid) [Pandoraea oxalativorans]|uniref:DUF883 domain-containing protein n=2 Tax=Pandoraea oxalativorans TaxID=573737 RepID=A0A0G3IDH5_9BURK|nr:DUF883 family protein [Pandoraea oxalativorans]AKK24653.1 hypothetical protein MB84_27840 [Pandoraea oxalativorans]
MADIKSVLTDAEDLLTQAANASGERASELSAKALALLEQARVKASDVQVVVVEKSKQAARATDDYVHGHPWQAAGVGIGLGVLVGLLLHRK